MEASYDMIRFAWEVYLTGKLDEVDPDLGVQGFTTWMYVTRNQVVSTSDVLDALNSTQYLPS